MAGAVPWTGILNWIIRQERRKPAAYSSLSACSHKAASHSCKPCLPRRDRLGPQTVSQNKPFHLKQLLSGIPSQWLEETANAESLMMVVMIILPITMTSTLPTRVENNSFRLTVETPFSHHSLAWPSGKMKPRRFYKVRIIHPHGTQWSHVERNAGKR